MLAAITPPPSLNSRLHCATQSRGGILRGCARASVMVRRGNRGLLTGPESHAADSCAQAARCSAEPRRSTEVTASVGQVTLTWRRQQAWLRLATSRSYCRYADPRRPREAKRHLPRGTSHLSLQNLARSANDCNGIASYCIYWSLSLVDYFRSTNDTGALASYQPYADAKLEHAHDIFDDSSTPLTFFGWDDRLGAGFFNASTVESQWDFVSLRRTCEVVVLVQNPTTVSKASASALL